MTSRHIPIKAIHDSAHAAPEPAGEGANVLAILHEVQAMLKALAQEGSGGIIDLRGVLMLPGEYERLAGALGDGEVRATIDAAGPTEVRETGYPGVWRVTHRNVADEVVADTIEVCVVPEILKSHPADVARSLERLAARLAEGGEEARDGQR